jgi:hypothetical protein
MACVLLAGCAGSTRDPAVARIGVSAITHEALARQMAAIAPEHVVPDPPHYDACVKRQQTLALTEGSTTAIRQECEQQYRASERRALDLLIAWQWLSAEAGHRHLVISDDEVKARSSGPDAMPALAGMSGEQAALQARGEVTAGKLRRLVTGEVQPVTRAQVAVYYRDHLPSFERPERRYLDMAEGMTAAGAAQYRREVLAGTTNLYATSLHEDVIGSTGGVSPLTRKAALRAILEAQPHVVSAPILLNAAWAVFEITRIVPHTRQPLPQVEQQLKARLETERRDRALARFIATWRRTWTARTSCAPGYIVQKCRQYRGPRATEEPLAFE